MIQAVMLDALAILPKLTDEKKLAEFLDKPPQNCLLTQARGGFTDVGLHTGGHARNTAWSLVIAVLQIMLD